LILNIDYDLTDLITSWQGRIIYQPYLNGTTLKGVWQNWPTLDGLWWADSAPGNTICPKATPCHLDDLLNVYPNAGLSVFFPAIGFKVGEGWVYEWIGNVDKFVIGVSGNTETYDFEPNHPPVLATIGPKSGNELTQIGFTANATDPDAFNTLTFSLDAGAPSGASINPSTGAFTWTPTEAQGPGVYPVTVRVTDNGTPNLSDFELIQITVNEVNLAPTLNPIGNKSGAQLTLISFTATATDPDLPANTLTFNLDAGFPSGASINASTGAFTWTPTVAQGPGVYPVTVRVTDNGTPALNDFETIQITVTPESAPVAVNDAYNMNGDTVLIIATPGVLNNDTDPNGDTLTAVLVTNVSHGMLTLNADGSFTYTPVANFLGIDTFTYLANDGTVDSNIATVTIKVMKTYYLYLPITLK
jgi:VCBS repeat-containing protein